jgi:hypothetical protein
MLQGTGGRIGSSAVSAYSHCAQVFHAPCLLHPPPFAPPGTLAVHSRCHLRSRRTHRDHPGRGRAHHQPHRRGCRCVRGLALPVLSQQGSHPPGHARPTLRPGNAGAGRPARPGPHRRLDARAAGARVCAPLPAGPWRRAPGRARTCPPVVEARLPRVRADLGARRQRAAGPAPAACGARAADARTLGNPAVFAHPRLHGRGAGGIAGTVAPAGSPEFEQALVELCIATLAPGAGLGGGATMAP